MHVGKLLTDLHIWAVNCTKMREAQPRISECGKHSRHRCTCIPNGPVTIAIQARYNIQHPARSYVLSSNNEHVNSFALL